MSEERGKRGIPRWLVLLFLLTAGVLVSLILFTPFEREIDEANSDVSKLTADFDEDPTLESGDLSEATEEKKLSLDKESQNNDKFEKRELDDELNDDNDDQLDLKIIADGDYLLALVTKETTLSEDYEPSDLEPIPSYMKPFYNMYLRAMALEMLKALWYSAREDGITLRIRSAYRSYSTQEGLFNDYASRHGEEEANRFSARPGQSEHQLGTTVDFGGTDVDLTADYAKTEQGRWLAEHAHRFGFALSYPEGKEHVTGYIYEPWHYRYIGVEAAHAWKDSGLTLKEYLAAKPQFYE